MSTTPGGFRTGHVRPGTSKASLVRAITSWPGGNRRRAVIGAVVLVVLLTVFGYWFTPLLHSLWSTVRTGVLPILLFLAACTAAVMARLRHRWQLGFVAVGLLAVAIATLLGMSYLRAHALYEASHARYTDDAASLSFEARAPYDVASEVSSRYLGDNVGTLTGKVKSIPSRGEYTTSITRRGWNKGYGAVQVMKLPTLGTATNADVSFCDYSPKARLKLGGILPTNGLGIALAHRTSPSTLWEQSDAFAVCDHGTPKLYIPLTRLKGWLIPIRVPAGVAVYNGRTGKLTIDRHPGATGLPVYPKSVAAAQRESTHASAGLFGYLFNRAGFRSSDNSDSHDPNASNPTEFSLSTTAGQSQLVTPLTPPGSSSSIVAVSTIRSDQVHAGTLAALAIHRFSASQTRQANSTEAANIISSKLSGYKASGLTVFEIIPAANGTWAASIGKSQSILYRAEIDPDGNITLRSADGDDSGTTTTPTTGSGTPLDKMTDAQLHAYIDQLLTQAAAANDELQSRTK